MADSGANINLEPFNANKPSTKLSIPLTAHLSNGKTIIATHKTVADLLPELSLKAREAYMFPNLEVGPIIAIPKLCDDGYM